MDISLDEIMKEMGMSEAELDEVLSNPLEKNDWSERDIERSQELTELSCQSYVIQNTDNGQLIALQPQCDANQTQEAQQLEVVCPQPIHFSQTRMEAMNSSPLNSESNEYLQYQRQDVASLPSNSQHEINMELIITEMPQSTIRFRPRTDPNTHGVIQGKSATSSSSETYPTVQLKVTNNNHNIANQNHEYYVVVDCYIKSDENTPILSPHIFGCKRTRNNSNEINKDQNCNKEDPKYDVIDGPIVAPMTKLSINLFEYSFKNFFIISQSKNALNAVKEKYKKYHDMGLKGCTLIENFQNYINSKKTIITQSNKIICLGFSIFEKIQNVFEYRLGPKLSTPIDDANKTVQLTRVCNKNGPMNGGEEITLLVAGITEKNVTVHIMEDDGNWSTKIENAALNVHLNAAITFRLPPYGGQNRNNGDVNCQIYLTRKDAKSEPSRFVYLQATEPRRKVTRVREERNGTTTKRDISQNMPSTEEKKSKEVYSDGVSQSPFVQKPISCKEIPKHLYSSKDVKKDIKYLKELLINANSENRENIYEEFANDSIFHDAIEHDEFLKLYQVIQEYYLKELVTKARNDFGDTVLHHACRLCKHQFLRALIGMNSRLSAQNNQRQTPLHVAIESGDKATIEVWTTLIKDPTQYEHFNEDFKRSLRIYDKQGFTALHRAIINDQRALVKAIMEFCQSADIQLDKYEVLGNGDSILHLAFSRDLKEMMKLIMEIEPDSIYYENYKGENYKGKIAEDYMDLLNNLSLE